MSTSDLEERALRIIKRYDKKGGIIQIELYKKLKISGKEGYRLVLKLLRKGLIKREEVIVNGRKTYRLTLVKHPLDNIVKVHLNLIMHIPCFTCKELERCALGTYFNPITCSQINDFLKNLNSGNFLKKLDSEKQNSA